MTKHGMKPRGKSVPEYTAWRNMLSRCRNPKDLGYRSYGGRGIKVNFDSFEDFFSHVGHRPPGTSIDRINNDGHYEKGNVRWANKVQQMSNRSDNRVITHNGKTQIMAEWAREKGIPLATLCQRIRRSGWSEARAIDTPVLSITEISKIGHSVRWR